MHSRVKTSAPQEFDQLKDMIARRYSTLSRQLQKIARFALEYPNDFALETVAALANRVEVQPSSVVRFAQALGYDGFSDMQQVFRTHLVTRSESYRERIRTLRKEHSVDVGGVDAVLADFVDESMTSLQLLRDSTSASDLEKAVSILVNASDIYLLAERRAFPVAFYLAYALGRLEQRAYLLDGVGGMLVQQTHLARPQDALIAISFPPYSSVVVDLFADRNEHGVPTVAITDSPVSPLALEATVAFGIKQQEERAFRSLTAPMCLAQTLVVSLGHHLASNNNGKAAKK